MHEKIAAHVRSETLRWDVYRASSFPHSVSQSVMGGVVALCTIADRLVLCHNHRGRDVIGGHIEPGENREDALRREAYEEGGVCVASFSLWGYIQWTSTTPSPRPGGGYYPYPHSYTPRCHCPLSLTIDERYANPSIPCGQEIDDVMLCECGDLETIDMQPCVKDIVRLFMEGLG